MPQHRLTQREIDKTLAVLKKHGGNQIRAAAELGMARATLQQRMMTAKTGRTAEAAQAEIGTKADLVKDLAEHLRVRPGLSHHQWKRATKAVQPDRYLESFGSWTAFKSEALKLLAPNEVTEGSASSAEVYELKDRVRTLNAQLSGIQREQLTDRRVREQIIGLKDAEISIPEWVLKPCGAADTTSVPTLFVSDLHWGEIVDADQVDGVNAFDLAIAHDRIKVLASSTIDLLRHHMGKMKYPGIVMPFGGDMVTGDIHEELTATNEMEIMPTVLDLWGSMVWLIETMAEEFGQVFVPCVTGNHGRNTRFTRAKGRNHTSYDWLLYNFLAKHFEAKKDARVKFLISPAADCLYQVYGHRYLLSHGDQFKGGDGIIGPLGPLTRGNKKKAARNVAIRRDYDTMIVGHWHTYMSLMRLIVNGALKGYDEYAYVSNFDYEPPQQALWLTHSLRGITISAPVQVDPKQVRQEDVEWVKWAA